VELDLSTFEKRVPVEMLGGSIFPPIGQLTYLLTLPPYGFYSFQLAEAVKAPTWHAEAPEPMPEYQTLVLRQGMADLVRDPRHRPVLERDVLPAYLGMRRWFAGKDERLKRVRIGTLSQIGDDMLLAEIEADVGDRTEQYLLPLGIAWEAPNLPALPQRLALARVRRGSRVGYLTDAFTLEAVPRGIVAALMRGDAVASDGGEILFRPTPQLAEIEPTAETEVRWLSAEQSNSTAIIDDQVVVKLIRRIIPGIHPEAEMTRKLTAAGVKNVPALLGEVVRVDKDGVPATVGIVQAFVRNQGDAWGWTLDYLRRSMEETGQAEADDLLDDSLRGYEAFAGAIGRRLAEVHLALAMPSEDPAFAPERLEANGAKKLGEEIAGEIDTAMQRLAEVESWPDEASRLAAESLLARREALVEAAKRLAGEAVGTLLTRVHGDFHLGQVLVVQSDAYIVDFEGEPVRSLEERRAKSSPMRDVAGLIRSFDYAGAALEDAPGGAQLAPERREVLLERFRERAEAAFLAGYDETAGAAPWMEQEDTLLALYLLAKAAYEVRYEAANRPAWIGLPTRGLARVADRLLGVERMEAEPGDG
jgi:maltose alpha-D-glucosyltransferase/alpha-amylase